MRTNLLFNKTNLKERGWTEAAIRDFLGEPDNTEVNPYYRGGPRILLWTESRVIQAERTKEFCDWKERSADRRELLSKLATERAQSSRRELLTHINAIKISIPLMSIDSLDQAAWERYYNHANAIGRWDHSGPSPANRSFLDRISVNYLRHQETDYEEELEHLFGAVGRVEGYLRVKDKVLAAIARAYPHLRAECRRQQRKMRDQY